MLARPWLRAAKRGGEESLKARRHPGRKPFLSPRQKLRVRGWINGKDLRRHGFNFGLWTRWIVAELIEEKLGVRLGVTAVGRLLAELAITPQKPLRSADERDPVAIERWQREAFPRLRTRAKRVAAKRFFLDEAGVDLVHARTQEPKLGDRELERPLAAEPSLQRVRVEARRRAAREPAGLRHPERELAGARPRDRPTAGRAQPRRRGDLPVSRV
jgi:transposase